MTDLGIYNFIKGSLAQGKSKEEITKILSQQYQPDVIAQAFADVEGNHMPDRAELHRPGVSAPVEQKANAGGISQQIIFFIVMVVLIAGGYYFFTNRVGAKPNIEEATTVLRAYFEKPSADNCAAGTVTLNELSDVRVEAYSSAAGGWPLFAKYKKTCRMTNSHGAVISSTAQSDGTEAPAAYVRKDISGTYEIFVPDMLKE